MEMGKYETTIYRCEVGRVASILYTIGKGVKRCLVTSDLIRFVSKLDLLRLSYTYCASLATHCALGDFLLLFTW